MDMEETGMTGIIPATYYWGKFNGRIGSTYIRVDPLVAADKGFEIWVHGKKYDNLIFQQFFWKGMMELFQGPKILDISDPDWIHHRVNIAEAALQVGALVCSSQELTDLVAGYFPEKIVKHIPDRIDMGAYPVPRGRHKGPARTAVWFGYIRNAHETLDSMADELRAHGMKLVIIADGLYQKTDGIAELEPEFIVYNRETVYEQLKKADIMLNPRSQRAFFKYKSNNKSLVGWRMGLPVAVAPGDIGRLADADERNREVERQWKVLADDYRIERTAEEYRDIIREIRTRK